MQHTKTGLASNYLANGTVAIDLGFMLVYPREKKNGAPVEGILPCEGVGYSLGGASIIKGARNLDNAKLFMDFVLVSSRASYEMVQKSVACGIELLVAISAATDLAVNMAEQHNLSLLALRAQ